MQKSLGIVVAVLALGAGYFFLAPRGVNPDQPMRIEDAFVRSSSKSAKAGAAFMVIHNQSGKEDRLLGAKTDAAAMAELHTHIEDANGVMMMRQIEGGIDIPKGGSAPLQRGGDHVMLMGLTGRLSDGQAITVTLRFEQAGEVVVEVPVKNGN